MYLEGFQQYKQEDADKYNKYRWWLGLTWGDLLNKAADLYPAKRGARGRYEQVYVQRTPGKS